MAKPHTPRIAVVGLGPRGVGALEALAALAMGPAGTTEGTRDGSPGAIIEADVFEPHPSPGAGPNFDPDESDLCRLNIPFRDIDLRAPGPLGTRSLTDWLSQPVDPDAFPPRPRLGDYLQHRLDALGDCPALALTRMPVHVTRVTQWDDGWHLTGPARDYGPYDEVLLVPGQPSTRPDKQLRSWQDHATQDGDAARTLAQAYPAQDLVDHAADWRGATVAVRGFALSAFDVVRALTQGLGGRFTSESYVPSGQEPRCILPFSLDGQPPYPKPETEQVDAGFEPAQAETDDFAKAIAAAASAPSDAARDLVTGALIAPVLRIMADLGAPTSKQAIADWLATEWSDPGTQDHATAYETLRQGIAMAEGSHPPSLGFTIGQVWRKWQDALRQGYNSADTPDETAALLIGFDEGLKRYSYGPPVDACRELLTLIDQGIVSTDLSRDPAIRMVDGGWQLGSGQGSVTARVMVDAVLPAPDPQQVTDPLITGLLEDGWLSCPEDLGARTGPDGRLIGSGGDLAPGLSLLGRLALGSVIAVDSLHDCFGAASHRWAEGVVHRLAPAEPGHERAS